MLIFPLKKEWYEKIKSGEKTVEYREVKNYWEKRLWKSNCLPFVNGMWVYEDVNFRFPVECIFQLGYKPETRFKAIIHKVEIVDGKNTDLKINKPVYAIHFKLNVQPSENGR